MQLKDMIISNREGFSYNSTILATQKHSKEKKKKQLELFVSKQKDWISYPYPAPWLVDMGNSEKQKSPCHILHSSRGNDEQHLTITSCIKDPFLQGSGIRVKVLNTEWFIL